MTTNNDLPLTLTPERIAVIIESILFVADRPISLSELVTTIDVSQERIETGLDLLKSRLQQRGLRIQEHKGKLQFVSAPDMTVYIERFLGLAASSKLSTAALEALGIIAYRQPITRPEIEAIRGVNCDGVLRTLLSKGLIEEVGRLDTAGRPIQYGTTFEFLQYFGLNSLEELPALKIESALDLKTEAA